MISILNNIWHFITNLKIWSFDYFSFSGIIAIIAFVLSLYTYLSNYRPNCTINFEYNEESTEFIKIVDNIIIKNYGERTAILKKYYIANYKYKCNIMIDAKSEYYIPIKTKIYPNSKYAFLDIDNHHKWIDLKKYNIKIKYKRNVSIGRLHRFKININNNNTIKKVNKRENFIYLIPYFYQLYKNIKCMKKKYIGNKFIDISIYGNDNYSSCMVICYDNNNYEKYLYTFPVFLNKYVFFIGLNLKQFKYELVKKEQFDEEWYQYRFNFDDIFNKKILFKILKLYKLAYFKQNTILLYYINAIINNNKDRIINNSIKINSQHTYNYNKISIKNGPMVKNNITFINKKSVYNYKITTNTINYIIIEQDKNIYYFDLKGNFIELHITNDNFINFNNIKYDKIPIQQTKKLFLYLSSCYPKYKYKKIHNYDIEP